MFFLQKEYNKCNQDNFKIWNKNLFMKFKKNTYVVQINMCQYVNV